MRSFALICLILLAGITARATTNLPPATSLLLNEKASFELTAGLAQYENPPAFAGKFTSVGGGSSAILVNRWAAEFARLYPQVQLDLHGGGSETGLAGLIEGKVDLVPMNRPVPAEDIARFKAKFGYEPSQIVVAQDAEAVYVNKNNPIAGLTLAQLDAIYSDKARRGGGRPEFWQDLGVSGPLGDERINRVSLSQVHSSYLYFQEVVMQGAEYRFDVHFEVVPSSLAQAVGADDAGVGFASVMFATKRTRFVPLQATDGTYVLPSYENVLSDKYPLTRPMRIVFNRKPDGSMNPAVREFLRFAVSRYGQRIIALAGSYPLTVEQQQEALQTIGETPPKATR
ncbi:MAG TPA: PstS family phosphate ABC transporter substrate-binding protein [Candidatus Acidoferrales bacterium]|nr:PstS family phosphate ABC transporter substrate-binding protein [Candidatus Acidoferrales bacterium]